jgi:phosphoribosylglycinamide formyltransferase 2
MQIGTPLSNNALKVMLLGGGELGKEVVISLMRLGIETIVVDRYKNAPAQQVAHRYHVINMTDGVKLENIINLERPDIIIPEIEAIATETLLKIEQQSISRVIPCATAVNLTMNRKRIRTLAHAELGLATSNYFFANNLQELVKKAEQMGYPCFIKPIMSSSGKGQSFVKSALEVAAAWDYAQTAGRVSNIEVIVESCIDFDYEITLLTVRSLDINGNIVTNFCNPIGHIQVSGDYIESWQPHAMSEAALNKAHHIAKTITDSLGGLGLFGVELFVKGDMVWFSEVSPRPHDTGMVTMITQYQNEFDLHVRAILGLPVDVRQKEIGASHVIYGAIDKAGVQFNNLEKALAIPNTDIRLFGKPESFIKRRMGVALAFADTLETARTNAYLCASSVRVID